MRAAHRYSSVNPDPNASLITLIEQIGRRKEAVHVYIKRKGLSLRIERRPTANV
jgi:hypothetical protein